MKKENATKQKSISASDPAPSSEVMNASFERRIIPDENSNTIQSALLKVVERKDIDPDRLEKFLDLHIKIEDRQSAASFNLAIAGFQGDCPIIPKTKKVNFTSKSGNKTQYDYAPIDEIAHIIKPILKRWGLSYTFNIEPIDKDSHKIIVTIRHSQGHKEITSYSFNPLHDDTRMNLSQRAKSAVTFAKRAALENALGLITAGEDDDARRAIDTEVTSAQLDEIYSLIESTQTVETELLKFLKADSLSRLSAQEAKKAIHALKQKRSR